KKPFVLGHETSGIVHRVGERVVGLAVGDRVALEPGEGCLRCDHCKSGHYAHCDNMKFAAALGRDGTLQGFYTLPADLCYKLPQGMTLDDGALIEPLAVAVHAIVHAADLKPNTNIVIFGAGPVGLLTMAVAKALGARKVYLVDVNPSRLEFAESYVPGVATYCAPLPAKGEENSVYAQRQVRVLLSSVGPNLTRQATALESTFDMSGREAIDLVVECSGAESCVQTGLLLLRKRGTFVQVGNSKPYANIPLLAVINKELTVRGSFRYGPGCFSSAIDLVSRGLISLKPLITHKYEWADAVQAYETTTAAKGPDGRAAIKVLSESIISDCSIEIY
ncbi:xylitol dehydrogenase, partial [Dioszegia hungarica]